MVPTRDNRRAFRRETRKVFIVEDHDWAREALARMLALQPGLEVCGTAASVEQALATIPAQTDLLLTDLALGDTSALDLIRKARAQWPHLRCVVLSNHPADVYGPITREAGSVGYVEKGDAPALLSAIETAFRDPA